MPRIIIIPIGSIVRYLFEDPRRTRRIVFMAAGLSVLGITSILLFVAVDSGPSTTESTNVVMAICGCSVFVMVCAIMAILVAASRKPEPSSSATWLTLSQAANYVQINETEITNLIKSGKLQARKVDGKYRIERGILDLFISRNRSS